MMQRTHVESVHSGRDRTFPVLLVTGSLGKCRSELQLVQLCSLLPLDDRFRSWFNRMRIHISSVTPFFYGNVF
jgi:hypothetical protein